MAFSASFSAASGKSIGMPWVAIAIRLTERASVDQAEPLGDARGFGAEIARAGARRGRSRPPSRPSSRRAGTIHSAFWRRSVGSMRPPCGWAWNTPTMLPACSARRLRVRPSYLSRADAACSRASTRAPGARAAWPLASARMKMIGGRPGPSQTTGRARASPSRSMPVTSTTAFSGRRPGCRMNCLRPGALEHAVRLQAFIRPRRAFLSSGLTPKARATSRRPTFCSASARKALIDSRVGNGAVFAGFTRGFLCTVFMRPVWGQAGRATISIGRLQPCNFGRRRRKYH